MALVPLCATLIYAGWMPTLPDDPKYILGGKQAGASILILCGWTVEREWRVTDDGQDKLSAACLKQTVGRSFDAQPSLMKMKD